MKFEHMGQLIQGAIVWILWIIALLLTIRHPSIERIPPFAILTAFMVVKTMQNVKQIIDCNKENEK